MIRLITFVTLFFGHFPLSFGQDPKSDTKLSRFIKLDLGGQGIGLTYEPRLASQMTVDMSTGFGPAYDIAEGSIEISYGSPAFYVSLTPKFFYNRQTRIDKGKSSFFNAGNYVGLRLKYVSASGKKVDFYRNSMLANLHWGVQRGMGKHWTFNFHIGAGYAQDIDYNFGTIYPAIDFKFSYVFFRSKK